MTAEEKKVIFASSLGTVFEWYDFYLYGSLAAVIAKQFFAGLDPTSAYIFALLAFAAGFLVRPFGALVFGRLGDMIGRKYTFLVTILIMGSATFIVGCLPNYNSIGVAAPIILIVLRMLQGLALGGEYGGAATYVAEHAPQGRRGLYTSWIQTTATLGLFLSLIVILLTREFTGKEFDDWGWRIPFLVSIFLLAISVWIRLSMNESPAFQKMKEEGKVSKAPLAESFGQWKNLKIVILALLGLTAGQAVVWYSGQFYALFFLTQSLKVDGATDLPFVKFATNQARVHNRELVRQVLNEIFSTRPMDVWIERMVAASCGGPTTTAARPPASRPRPPGSLPKRKPSRRPTSPRPSPSTSRNSNLRSATNSAPPSTRPPTSAVPNRRSSSRTIRP